MQPDPLLSEKNSNGSPVKSFRSKSGQKVQLENDISKRFKEIIINLT
jgi:hypothetical protein